MMVNPYKLVKLAGHRNGQAVHIQNTLIRTSSVQRGYRNLIVGTSSVRMRYTMKVLTTSSSEDLEDSQNKQEEVQKNQDDDALKQSLSPCILW